MIPVLMVAGLAGLAAGSGLLGIGLLARSWHARARLVMRAEDHGLTPDVLGDPLYRGSMLARWTDRYNRAPARAADRERLRKAYLDWRPSTFRLLQYGSTTGVVLLGLLGLRLPLPLVAALAALSFFVLPRVYLRMRNDAFLKAFNAQTVEITQTLANGLRAGMSIQQAIGHLVEIVDEPARSEFRQAYNELLLGDDLVAVLTRLGVRVDSRDLHVVLDAIAVQYQAGGNLAKILHSLADTVLARQQLHKEISALMSEYRYASMLVPLLPLLTLVLLRNSVIGKEIFDTSVGWGILAVYAVLQVGVYIIFRRASRFEV